MQGVPAEGTSWQQINTVGPFGADIVHTLAAPDPRSHYNILSVGSVPTSRMSSSHRSRHAAFHGRSTQRLEHSSVEAAATSMKELQSLTSDWALTRSSYLGSQAHDVEEFGIFSGSDDCSENLETPVAVQEWLYRYTQLGIPSHATVVSPGAPISVSAMTSHLTPDMTPPVDSSLNNWMGAQSNFRDMSLEVDMSMACDRMLNIDGLCVPHGISRHTNGMVLTENNSATISGDYYPDYSRAFENMSNVRNAYRSEEPPLFNVTSFDARLCFDHNPSSHQVNVPEMAAEMHPSRLQRSGKPVSTTPGIHSRASGRQQRQFRKRVLLPVLRPMPQSQSAGTEQDEKSNAGYLHHREQATTRPRRVNATTTRRTPKARWFCSQCDKVEDGFVGKHEHDRHVAHYHATVKRVWICCDPGTSTRRASRDCKECRTNSWPADYNAAAHLRRIHFNPMKRGRCPKGEIRESRAGKTGGSIPSIKWLKDHGLIRQIDLASSPMSSAQSCEVDPGDTAIAEEVDPGAAGTKAFDNAAAEACGDFDTVGTTLFASFESSPDPHLTGGFEWSQFSSDEPSGLVSSSDEDTSSLLISSVHSQSTFISQHDPPYAGSSAWWRE